jgi:predicted RNA-binding protein with PIN domain
MLFLVDGYNLMYSLGYLTKRTRPQGLEAARGRLLAFLRDAHGDESHRVTVVFDAKHAPENALAERVHDGIRVLFALTQEQADDLLEEMIRKASVPKQLAVVSDDRRVRTAGERRQCLAWSCNEYLDYLEGARSARHRPRPAADGGKPEKLSQEETQRWLEEFGGLDGLAD